MTLGFLTDARPGDATFARETGYDCLELALFGDPPDVAEFAREAKDQGVPVAAVSLFGQDYFGSQGHALIARLQRALDAAAHLEAPVLVFGSGAGCPSTHAALEKLDAVIERAESLGVRPAFYNCHWENEVDRPSAWEHLPKGFGVKFDPSHPVQLGRDWKAELLAAGDRLVHAHAKDVLQVGDRFVADPNPGLGDIRWESFFGLLYHLEFAGAVCVEPHSPLYTGERRYEFLRRSHRYLRQFVGEV